MKKYIQYSSLIMSIILLLDSIVTTIVTTDHNTHFKIVDSLLYESEEIRSSVLDYRILAGLFFVVFTIVLIFIKRALWVPVFSMILLIALSPFIQFWGNNYYLGIGMIKIEMVTLTILFIHIIVNIEVIQSWKSFLFEPPNGPSI